MLTALLNWEARFFRLLHIEWASPALDRLMPWVSDARNYTIPFIVAALVILFAGRWRGLRFLVLAVISVVVADAISTHLIKYTVWRIRPCTALEEVRPLVGCVNSPSFPSNHAVNSGTLAALVFLYLPRLALPAAAFTLLVGYSRVYVGAHYPLDVLAGWALGLVVAVTLSRVMSVLWPMDPTPERRRRLFSLHFEDR